jgi:hypothetical protein
MKTRGSGSRFLHLIDDLIGPEAFQPMKQLVKRGEFVGDACRASTLARIRAALNIPKPAATVEPADYRERYAILAGHRIDLCPVCTGRMVEIGRWPRSASPLPPPPRCDTS